MNKFCIDTAIAGTIDFKAPRTNEPRHYTLYMTLASAGGKILCENWDHFVVVKNARTFKPPEGISPPPRFSLELKLSRNGKPFAGSTVSIADKYNPQLKYEAKLNDAGGAAIKEMLPGAYRLSVGGDSFEFLLNKNEHLEIDFRPGIKTVLGARPIIDWPIMATSKKQ